MHAYFELAHYKSTVWTLVDSDESQSGIPEEFAIQDPPFFVIYATFPAKERWSQLGKTSANAVIVMNPWSQGEIHQV